MKDIIKNKVEISDDPSTVPRRIAVFPEKTPVRFEEEKTEEKLVMTFPNLIIREVICFQTVVIILTLISLFINAPLEELANPQNTPNPAKAPWYFLGLQELLHSFPPIVAGVLLPMLVVIALIIIPYFNVNIKKESLWRNNSKIKLINFSAVILTLVAVSILFDAYSIAVPTILFYVLVILPYFVKKKNRLMGWLYERSLSDWIMIWFVSIASILTVIGTYFRGPGWSWVWPW